MSDGRELAAGVREGDVLAGKYRVERVLGVGGMGVVVAAHHVHLDERVAIKFLLPHALGSKEAITRFSREARAAARIKSEHVTRVTDVGTLDNGAPYMVMEYLEGSDLAGWLSSKGPLTIEDAVDFVLQACEAIAEAHALGIVHRDLKPSNLFVTRRPDGALSVKVLDFGISKTTGLSGSGDMTHTSAIMGSPLYMSPEHLHSAKDADARSDVWALGVILYELLTADTPFIADSMPGLVARILSAPPESLRKKRPDVPEGLEAVVFKCLERDRGKRYRNVGELASALVQFAPKRSRLSLERITGVLKAAGLAGTAVSPPSSDESSVAPPGRGTEASWGRTTELTGRHRWLFAGGFALVLAAGIALTTLRKRDASEKAAASSTEASSTLPARASGAPTPPPSTIAEALPRAAPEAPSAASNDVAPSSSTPRAETPLPAAKSPAVRRPRHDVAKPAEPKTAAENPPTIAPAEPAKPNCNPNYYLDAHGNKHFKPECF